MLDAHLGGLLAAAVVAACAAPFAVLALLSVADGWQHGTPVDKGARWEPAEVPQKNIGPAGLTILVVREDLLGRARRETPSIWNYAKMAADDSMSNTPPTFAWYVAGLVFADLKAKGGLEAMAAVNERKARKLYVAIDSSPFYSNPVREDCRSWMNVPFILKDPALDAKFLAEAEAAGLMNLRGHRAVGGMRASIYNAIPEAGVDALIDFMQDFEKRA